jgi:hypothetical protein
LRFAPVPVEEIERFLIEGRAFSHDEARLASRLSRGSIALAASMRIDEFRSRRDLMLGVLRDAIDTGDRAALMRAADEINDAKNKDKFVDSLDTLESLIHDVWSLRAAGDGNRLVNSDLADELSRLADDAGRIDLAQWLDSIAELRENLAVNINRKIAAAALFTEMAG